MDFESVITKLLDVLIEDRDHKVPMCVIRQDIKNVLQPVYDYGYSIGYDMGVLESKRED